MRKNQKKKKGNEKRETIEIVFANLIIKKKGQYRNFSLVQSVHISNIRYFVFIYVLHRFFNAALFAFNRHFLALS